MKNIGSPNVETIEKNEKEHKQFLKKIARHNKTINWAIVVIFFLGITAMFFTSIFPIFAVKNRVAKSTFDNNMENKIIQDYYKEDSDKKKDLPFDDLGSVSDISDMNAELKQETENLTGSYGIYIKNLTNGEEYGLNQDQKFTAASLAKLFVVGAAYQKMQEEPDFIDQNIFLRNEDRVDGNGSLFSDQLGSSYNPDFLIEKMLSQSDNTAFTIMTRALGMSYVNKYIDKNGFANTDFGNNDSSPKDIGLFLDKLNSEQLMQKEFKDQMLGYMQNTAFEDRLPYYLPKSVKVSHKIGTWGGAYSDAGIVFSGDPYIIVVMTDGANQDEAVNTIRKISDVVYRYINK